MVVEKFYLLALSDFKKTSFLNNSKNTLQSAVENATLQFQMVFGNDNLNVEHVWQ